MARPITASIHHPKYNPGRARRAWRRWNRGILAAVLLVASSVVAMNVLVDPYQVFRVIEYRNGFAPNEWDNKFDWLSAHPEQADILLLGSSRMGLFDPRWLEAQYPGRRAYNFSKLAARPSDIARLLPALERAGLAPREIILGIDVFPFLSRNGDRGPAHFDPPFISGESRAKFLSRYLFLASFLQSGLRLNHQRQPLPELVFDHGTILSDYFGLRQDRL